MTGAQVHAEVRAEAERIAAVLLAASREIDRARRENAAATAAERLRWRRVEQVIATAAAEIGCPGMFAPIESPPLRGTINGDIGLQGGQRRGGQGE